MVPYSVKISFQCHHLKLRARKENFLKPQIESYNLGFYPTLCDHREAELCQFEVSGKLPSTKMARSWERTPFWRKNSKVCYPPKLLFRVFTTQTKPGNVIWATFCVDTLTDPCSSEVLNPLIPSSNRVGNIEEMTLNEPELELG